MTEFKSRSGMSNPELNLDTIPEFPEGDGPKNILRCVAEDRFPPGVSLQTWRFLLTSIRCGVFGQLNARAREIIDGYFGTRARAVDLRETAGVKTPDGVRRIIHSGMMTMLEALPTHLKQQFANRAQISLKEIHAPDTRARRREGAIRFWEDDNNRARIAEKARKRWADPQFKARALEAIRKAHRKISYRIRISESVQRARQKEIWGTQSDDPDGALWNFAVRQGLLSKIIKAGKVTSDEVEILGTFFGRRKEEIGSYPRPSEDLLNRFSIAVANEA